MIFNGLGTYLEDQGNGFGGLTFSNQLENFALASGQFFERVLSVSDFLQGQFVAQAGRDFAAKVDFAVEHALEGRGQFRNRSLLEQIAAGTGAKRLPIILFVFVAGEDDDPDLGKIFSHAGGGFQPIEPGHGNIHENDVGLERAGHFEGLTAIAGFADDLDFWQAFQFHANAGADDGMIIGKQDAGRFRSIVHSPRSTMHFGALAGSRAKGEFAPCQGGPFFHAHQTEAGAAQGPLAQGCDVEADAVIANREMKLAVLLAQFHRHDSGLRMPGDIGQGFLGDAETFVFDHGIEAFVHGIGAEFGLKTGERGLTPDVPAQGRHQTQIVEHRGAQAQREVLHLFEDALDGLLAFLEAAILVGGSRGLEGSLKVHFGDGEGLADFIVQSIDAARTNPSSSIGTPSAAYLATFPTVLHPSGL